MKDKNELIPRKSYYRTKTAQKNLRKDLLKYWQENKVLFNRDKLKREKLTQFYNFHDTWADATHGWGEVFKCDQIIGWEGITVSQLKAKLCYMDSEKIHIDLDDTPDYEDPEYQIGELWRVLLMECENNVFDRALKNIMGKSPEHSERTSPPEKKV